MKVPLSFEEEEFIPIGDASIKPKKKSKTVKKKEFTHEQLAICRERLGLKGDKFPESTPDEWVSYNDGTIWVHRTEMEHFEAYYGKSALSGKWFHRNSMVRTIDDSTIGIEEVDEFGFEKCNATGYWDRKERMLDALIVNRAGEKSKVRICRPALDNRNWFACQLTGNIYQTTARALLTRADGVTTKVSIYEIRDNPNYKKCGHCEGWTMRELIEPRVFDGGRIPMCTPCYNKELRRGLINCHNFDRYPPAIYTQIEFKRMTGEPGKRRCLTMKETNPRLFGVELEVEMNAKGCKSDGIDRFTLAQQVKETLGSDFVMLKEDGSLNENGKYSDPGAIYAGFEIVSAPADLEVHKSKWKKLESMRNFKHLRAWDTETCGMHVHVSRDALSTLQIGRILTFMTHEENKKFVAKVAGRGENKYCRVLKKEKFSSDLQYGEFEVKDGIEYVKASYQIPRNDENRRQAVNITNERTIEFRIFRGTVHPRHIIRNMEFVDAMCNFCYPGSRSFQALLDWREFVNYCADNRKSYPLLVEWYESDTIKMLPKRNAYGPKDTRGTKKPEVIEALPGPTKTKIRLMVDENGRMAARRIMPNEDDEEEAMVDPDGDDEE
jgi:hypothetical protein